MISATYETLKFEDWKRAGVCFRRPKGEVWYELDKIEIDRSYEQHYNFITIIVRLVNCNTLRGKWVNLSELECEWVKHEPVAR